MSGFSFSTTAGASQSTAQARLSGNDIYTVQFDGCEIVDIKGVKDTSMLYKVLKLRFANADGTFEHTIFEPKSTDFVRTETEYTDKVTGKINKIPQASGVESTMLLFKHAIDSLNPSIASAIDAGTQNLGAKDWDDLRILVSKILDAGKGKTTHIKLLKNNKGEAQFPGFFAGISREGKAYVKNNFIGEKLAFTPYEVTRINNEATAVPTKVSSYGNNNNPELIQPMNDLDMTFDMPVL